MGTGAAVLIAVLLVVILVFLWGRERREKPVASNEQEHEYYKVDATGNDQQYEDKMYDSVGSGRVTTNLQGEVAVASNQAYGVLGHEGYEVEATHGNEQENEDYKNETYNSVGSGRVTINLQQGEVAVASNQAYGVFET